MNTKKRSITASLLLPATGVELLVVLENRRERGFAGLAFLLYQVCTTFAAYKISSKYA